jgi:large subunit ribosomal protein L5
MIMANAENSKSKKNPMRELRLEKVVVNIGIGDNENMYPNAKALLQKLTGKEAVPTHSKRREPELKIRKGQVIGAMVTLRGNDAKDMLKRALDANNNTVKESAVANNSLNFGVNEYIYFSGVKYDPKIGMLGLNVNAAFGRRGKRVELRRRKAGSVGLNHRNIEPDELRGFITEKFGAKFVGKE